ncbi:SDR family NAD(P)-dependent oxidoreductase [Agromyces aerolatus]|uniref:SDR family NAD(P)-dependent oxidoreductase n=1 Tax=Agromyces sp. LY-1074 TaxID=3074080 RepID=UPI002866504C|nr:MULTISPECIES: glucose 1-dehydrogenase [unclassified Agromyces]MDR5699107.1 glucose 1-dehydrogenase [Agromyces sp. LY-1074]MDR5705114.1 glucose 1-dehydrogenase [Agromyces sp. LY-1358]
MSGKVAIVTGGARGLGGAAASALAAEGASVVIADVLVDAGAAKVDEITAGGGTARFSELDVRDAEAWHRVVDETVGALGGLDVLVNNAGIALPRTIEQATLDEFRHVMDINLYGPFLGVQAALPALKARGSGSIVNVSSNSTEMIVPTTTYYAASKAALANLTKTTAVHLATQGTGIRVNSVHPGPHATDMLANPEVARMPHIQRMRETIPLGRFGRPEEFGQLVVFLASDESSYITAAEFFIDGGLTRVSYANERAEG